MPGEAGQWWIGGRDRMKEGDAVYVPLFFGVSPEKIFDIQEPDIVFDFIKPHVLEGDAPIIRKDFRLGVERKGVNFAVLACGRTPQLSEEFWERHYGYLIEKYKGTELEDETMMIVPAMIEDFSFKYGQGIWWEVLLGKCGLCGTAREVLGDKKNPAPGTIRANYGVEKYNTIMHVSDLDKVKRELKNFAEHGINDERFDGLLRKLFG